MLPDPATSHSTTKCGWMAAPRSWAKRQTSLVADPRRTCTAHGTGRAGRAARSLESGQGVSGVDGRRGVDGPNQRSLSERCVTRGLPCLPDFYRNNFLILQTPDNMVILHERTLGARGDEAPRTARIPMTRSDDPFEYACHEGNYAMVNVLAGGRAEEQAGRR